MLLWPFVVNDMCLHRWLGYITLLLFDVLICLLVLFGLIRNSKGTLIAWVSQDSRGNSCDLGNDLAEWRLPYMKPLLHYCSVHTKKFVWNFSPFKTNFTGASHHDQISIFDNYCWHKWHFWPDRFAFILLCTIFAHNNTDSQYQFLILDILCSFWITQYCSILLFSCIWF